MKPYDNITLYFNRNYPSTNNDKSTNTIIINGRTVLNGDTYFGYHGSHLTVITIVKDRKGSLCADSSYSFTTLVTPEDSLDYHNLSDLIYLGSILNSPEYSLFRSERM